MSLENHTPVKGSSDHQKYCAGLQITMLFARLFGATAQMPTPNYMDFWWGSKRP